MKEEIRKLLLAEQKAKELFVVTDGLGLIISGKSENDLAEEIVELAKDHFGIEKYWHKKIVRSGPNTLYPYNGDPADRVIQKDDIVFLDFGPIFEGYEADCGRTYVIGNDILKLKLKNDVEAAWHEAKACVRQNKTTSIGAEYFNYATELAKKYMAGSFGGDIAGRTVGAFSA